MNLNSNEVAELSTVIHNVFKIDKEAVEKVLLQYILDFKAKAF